ncbi:ROK family transcriptional regulator [Paucilactobacillus kaifaensis]|uniref:ROK family transcriptional regulator n=1 Tax=Paucilactobacillus kaifaensis TaxID=2559921 RepID=UPI0010F9794E|nr:ROK family transcriptional regulator [Paucilactobacillus kaifaensis]
MALNKQSIRNLNEKSVLRQIFIGGPISRIQISRNLDLNKSTVSAIFNDLSDRELVVEMGQGESTQVGGRKPVMIKVNPKYGFTVNFDIGFHHLDVMGNYLEGTAFFYQRFDTTGFDIHQIIALMIKTVNSVGAADMVQGLLGISVAVHGIVFNNKVTYSPFIDMEDVSVYDELTTQFEVPVIIENEANLVATFQRDFSRDSHRTMNNIVVISIHKGIGAGIIIDHNIYRGEHGEAGEIGRSIYTMNLSQPQQAEKIENYASQDAILELIKQRKKLKQLNFAEVASLYEQHDSVVVEAIKDFCSYITTMVYNTAISFNPDAIYLSSDLIENIAELLPMIQAEYNQLPGEGKTDIRLLKGAKFASLLGGCSAATHQALGITEQQLKFNYSLKKAVPDFDEQAI